MYIHRFHLCRGGGRAGFSLVEVVLSAALVAMLAIAFYGVSNGQSVAASAGNRARAIYLAQEGLEGTRSIRDVCYNRLTPGVHGLSATSTQWQFSSTSDTTGIYTRQIVISTTTTSRAFATSTVTWQQDAARLGSVSLTTELAAWTISLGNWGMPVLGQSISIPGTADGIKIQAQGNYTYMVRNGPPDLVITDISSPAAPSVVGLYYGNNDSLTGIAVSGNYAYVSDINTSRELEVFDISNPAAPTVVGTYNSTVMNGANNIFVVGTKVYLVGSTRLQIIDVTNPAAPVALGSYFLGSGATANAVSVNGNYAYVATSDVATEVEILNISNPSSPTLVSTINLPGGSDAVAVVSFGSSIVVGQDVNLYDIDVSNPAVPVQRGVLATGGVVNDIASGRNNSYMFTATNNPNGELVVVDVSNFASPFIVGTFNDVNSILWNGVAYSVAADAAFGASPANNGEIISVLPTNSTSQSSLCQ